jgi:hypothetical protein
MKDEKGKKNDEHEIEAHEGICITELKPRESANPGD